MPTKEQIRNIILNHQKQTFEKIISNGIRYVTVVSNTVEEGFREPLLDIFPETPEEAEQIKTCFENILKNRK